VLLVALLAAGVAAFLFAPPRGSASDASRMTWVGDAHQFGPVGIDPAGAISPDGGGSPLEGRFRVRAADGGPLVDLPSGDAQIRTIAWARTAGRFSPTVSTADRLGAV
jgi:hypothetical protein